MSAASATRRGPTPLTGATFTLAGNFLLAVSTVGASQQSIQLQRQLNDLVVYYALPASSNRDRRRERFRHLSQQWKKETQFISSTTEIAMHPAYQAIIGMGADALPMILEDLRQNSGHWYWALKAISNEDPVPPNDRGIIRKMKSAWLRWGETKRLVRT